VHHLAAEFVALRSIVFRVTLTITTAVVVGIIVPIADALEMQQFRVV
jgi:hypothetical protein